MPGDSSLARATANSRATWASVRQPPYFTKIRALRGCAPSQRRGLPRSSPRLAAPGGALWGAVRECRPDGGERWLHGVPVEGGRDGSGVSRGLRRSVPTSLNHLTENMTPRRSPPNAKIGPAACPHAPTSEEEPVSKLTGSCERSRLTCHQVRSSVCHQRSPCAVRQ